MSADVEEVENHDDEFLLRRKRHRVHGDVISGLNLTAMMDMMTIILVFLIKRYGEAPENITINDDLRPPLSTSIASLTPSVSIYISQSKIVVDSKAVLAIEGGQVTGGTPEAPYGPLGAELERRVKAIEDLGRNGGSPFDGNVMIIADEKTPYDIIAGVLYQAGIQRFETYRLIVRAGGKQ